MSRPLQPEDLYAIRLAEDPQIAPDGSGIAYTVMAIDRPSHEYRRGIWLLSAAGGDARPFTAGPHDSTPRWSPDGRHIAFLRAPATGVKPRTEEERGRGVGKPQIWILPTDGGEACQLTFSRHGASDPIWSPEGETILYTTEVGDADDREAEDAKLQDKPVPAVRTIDRMWYRLDGKGWIYERRTHLFAVPVGGGEPRQLTDGDWDDASPAWSPDGRQIAFASDRSAERWRWAGSDIWVLDVQSGALWRLTDESLGCGRPAWSPDGVTLTFTASPRRHGDGHTDLMVVPTAGNAPARRLTEDFLPTCADTCISDQRAFHGPTPLYWSGDGRAIYFLASTGGTTHLFAVAAGGGEPRPLTEGRRHVYGISLDAARQSLALAISDPVIPGDVFAGRVDAPASLRRLTDLNASLRKEVQLATPEEMAFTGADGWPMQGWILPGRDRARPGPAVLEVHGGPHAMYGWSFFFEFQLLAAHGYTVVYCNLRGSTGYGRKFSGAVVGDWGGKDFQDLMAGLDAAIARGGVDPDQLGVAGGSYGGYMTNWAVGHTDRFKAAITMRCVSNLATMFGTSDIGWFMHDVMGTLPWEGLEQWMDRSPIKYVASVRTPLLILHSDTDLRCPISEAEQMYGALKYLGRVVKLVRFEGQTHDLSRNGHPRSRLIRLRHILDWLGAHIPAEVPALAAAAR
jgi:dipeptidyl aminopeptidase/acylaminoacyl peptidase